MINEVLNLDVFDGLKEVKDASVDLCIADPPYFNIIDETWDTSFPSQEDYVNWCLDWTWEICRVLKDGGQLYVYGGIGKNQEHPFLKYILEVEESIPLDFVNFITMRNFRVYGNSKHFPFARQELVVFSQGHPKTYNKQYSTFEGTNRLGNPKLVTNIWVDCKDVCLYNNQLHVAQKPELAADRIILSSSEPGDVVLVPFCGSGTECVSAKKLGRNYIGFDIDPESIKIASSRLESA